MPTFDPAAAERFLADSARVLERRLHARLFSGGPASGVRDAVAAYRTDDGGFGWGLEPDARSPHAHPAAISTALRLLHEAEAWDADLASGAADWLWRHAPAAGSAPPLDDPVLGPGGGGATFCDPAVEGWPKAPWWGPEPGLPPSVVQAGPICGLLRVRGVEHPWVAATAPTLWAAAEAWAAAAPDPDLRGFERIGRGYELRGVAAFLALDPDEARATTLLDGLAPHAAALVADLPGEAAHHRPHHLVPDPASRSARLLDPATVAADVDRLAAAQRDDGGWTFDWDPWSEASTADWRGAVTVEALRVLRDHGRRDA